MRRLDLKDEDLMSIDEFILQMDDSKKLRELEKLFLSNIEKGKVAVDYQLIFEIIRNLDLQIDKAIYLSIKDNRSKLINTLLKNQFKDCAIEDISKKFLDYLKRIMITYIDLDEPLCIDKFYSFEEKFDSDVLKQAGKQVLEGGVENRIFKELDY